ncbi:RluA family pseudouridine synthase [Desulfuromonas sp. AOP6]|uniref:RluA family pseudouridine synthase n=1 Tax=Desulfuromonas sp. AOP6 TaxID=1566351 RepID=UPI00128956A5|nr:RluA family pseudouridine synthase [Desulfuromonas sp. AOP6]BCA79165.1 pseudouridine synthase [Desulfuromonas sp. AOP6]
MPEYIVTPQENGLSPLCILKQRVPAAPIGFLRQLLRKGEVLRLCPAPSPDAPLAIGDRIVLPGSQRLAHLLEQPPEKTVDILYENDELLIAFKPSGLAMHRGVDHEEDNLVRRIERLLKKRKAPYQARPIHRLDLDTSGPVLFGKGKKAASALGKVFMAGKAQKKYLALVEGQLPVTGMLTSPVPAKGKLKESETSFRLLVFGNNYSLLELDLHSGRTHQIRRQLADAGHPLVGDRRYGGSTLAGLSRLFLHCHQLSLPPADDCPGISIDSPLPEDLGQTLAALGLHWPKTAPSVNSTDRTRHATAG